MGILYGRCFIFPVTTSRTLQLCPDCAAAVRREYRRNEVISIAGADGTSLRCITAAQYAMP